MVRYLQGGTPFLDLNFVKTFPILFCLFFLSEGPRRVRVDTALKKNMALSKTPRKSPGPMPPRYNYDFVKNIFPMSRDGDSAKSRVCLKQGTPGGS